MCKLIVSEASFKEVFLYDLGVGFFGAVKVDLYRGWSNYSDLTRPGPPKGSE